MATANPSAEKLRAMRIAPPSMTPVERAAREVRKTRHPEVILFDLECAAAAVLKRLRSLQAGDAGPNTLTETRLAVGGMQNLFNELRLAHDEPQDSTLPTQEARAL